MTAHTTINQSAPPSSYGDQSSILTAFDGDLSQLISVFEKRITGYATLGAPLTGGYEQHPENAAIFGYAYNSSGLNDDGSTTGRTGGSILDFRFAHAGQGDFGAIHVGGIVTGTHPAGATQFNGPAGVLVNGDLYAGADHAYLNVVEFNANDLGRDVAAIGFVFNATRTNGAAALQDVWFGSRFQSKGNVPADVAYSMAGPWNRGIDFTDSVLTSGAAIAMKGGDKVYLNAQSGGFIGWSKTLNGEWIDYSNGAVRLVVGWAPALTANASGVAMKLSASAPALTQNSSMTFELTSNTKLKIKVRGTDGVTRSTTLTLA